MTIPPQAPAAASSSGTQNNIDIRDALDAALKDKDINSDASFSFSRTYPEAPNPALSLAGIGLVGLPLSARDAELVKTRCVQAPFGMGERTIVDKTVRDTWEMDAKQVSFLNPKWNTFVTQALAQVCQTLGVNFAASRPRAELYKLLLYETGSHFLPHVDTEKADGMFATIVIVLPSKFTGGAAHLSHSELSVVYDCSANSQHDTTVLAWYTDVKHEIKPITSGYRLALSYNLIHTTTSLRPALSANTSLVEKLARVLLAWKNDETGTSPQKVVYLLDHMYSEANLRASALKGADAQKVAILESLAKRHGFRLGLANAHCHLTGAADDDGGSYYGRRRNCYYDEYDEPSDDDEVDFLEVYEREMTIEHFVDLDGDLISEQLEFDENHETIPKDLTRTIEAGEHDEQEYEGYMGNGAGSLERWYRRTLLVVWPERSNYDILYAGDHGLEHACDDLAESIDSERPPEQTQLIEFILSKSAEDPARAAETLCIAACDLEDFELWAKAVATCCPTLGISTLSHELKYEAIENFGFDTVRPSFELMLKSDKHNLSRLEFLSALVDGPWEPRITVKDKVRELHEQAKPWALEQLQETLKTLQKPTVAECPILLRAARVYGGINFLQESMLPQLCTLGDGEFLRKFAKCVFLDKEHPECEDKTHTVPTLLSTAIAKTTFYKPKPPPPAPPSYAFGRLYNRPAAPAPAANGEPDKTAKAYIQACFELGCPQLVGTVLDRVLNTSTLSPADVEDCAKSVMLPLASFVTEQLRAHPGAPPVPQVEALRATAMKLYLDWVEKNSQLVDRGQVAKLLAMCVVDGDPTTFMTIVVPRLEAMKLSANSCQALVDELRNQQNKFSFPEGYNGRTLEAVVLAFAQKYLAAIVPQHPEEVIRVLNWLSTTRLSVLYPVFFEYMTHAKRVTPAYMTKPLIPLLPQLRTWALQHGGLDTAAYAFQRIVAAWVDKVLGPPPPPNATLATQLKDLARWTCPCAECVQAKNFLTKTAAPSVALSRIGAPKRKHVEGFLSTHARGLATYDMIRGSPQGLSIRKVQALQTLMEWRVQQSNGKAMLKTISTDDNELRRLLGTEYMRVAAALAGQKVGPSVVARPSIAAQAAPAQAVASSSNASQPTANSLNANPPPVASNSGAIPPPSAAGSSSANVPLPAASVVPPAASPAVPQATPSALPPANPVPVAEVRRDLHPEQRPAKKRKMAPVDANDVIDLT